MDNFDVSSMARSRTLYCLNMIDENDLGRALIYVSGFFLSTVFFIYPKKQDRDFVRLSIFFIIAFFIFPAIVCSSEDSFSYLGKSYSASSGTWLLIGISTWMFILGYFSRDFMLVKRNTSLHHSGFYQQINRERSPIFDLRRVYFLLIFALLIRIVICYFSPSVEQEYEVRTGLSAGSHLNVLFAITSGSIYFAAIFVAAKLEWKFLTLSFLLGLLIFTFSGSSGRFNAAVAILIASIYVIRINTALLCVFFPILLIAAFPILASGKLLIFSIATNTELPSASEILRRSTQVESYLNNFSHPMVSLFQVERLLALSDFRWFYDFPQGFLFYLKFFGFDMGPSLTYYNTEAFLGYKSSIVPTGYLAFGFVQMSYFGVFVMGIFYRNVFYMFFDMKYIKPNLSPIFSFYIALTSANTFYTGEIRTLILQFFLNMIVINVCFWFVSKRCVRSTRSALWKTE